ncbi:MAG: hypothetical protein ACOYLO_10540 [Ferruginibacter sp.]
MHKISFIFGGLLMPFALLSQGLLSNTGNRKLTTLNGNWNYIVDPYETGARPVKELKDFRKIKLNAEET